MGTDLEKIYQVALEWAKGNGLSIFKGVLPEGNDSAFINTYWDIDEDDSIENFLDIAKSTNIKIIYVGKTYYDKYELDEARNSLDEMIRDRTTDKEGRESCSQILKKIESLDRYNGQLRSIDISFVADKVVHSYVANAGWNTVYTEIQSFWEEVLSISEEEEDE